MKKFIVIACLIACFVAPASADLTWNSLVPSETSAVVFTANGLGRAGITASYDIGNVYGFNPYLDFLLANNGDSGVGISVGLSPIGKLAGFDENAPIIHSLISRIAVGTSLFQSGESFDAGIYWRLRIINVKFDN